MRKTNYSQFLIKFTTGLLLLSLLSGFCISVQAANTYSDIKTSLPDDGSADNPNNIDSDSHEYISMQDNNNYQGDWSNLTTSPVGIVPDKDEAKVANIKLYSKSNKASDGVIRIRLNYINRDFKPEVACQGFYFNVDILQFDPSEQLFTNNISFNDTPPARPNSGSCVGSSTDITIPRSVLVASTVPEHNGLYTAVLRLTLKPNNSLPHSPTFHALATDGKTKIGYAGSRYDNMQVAIYPSNEHNRYRINFNARPTCDSLNDGDLVTVYWKGANDYNQQHNTFTDIGPSNSGSNSTPGNLSIKMYEIRPDGSVRDSKDVSPNATQSSMPYHKGMSYRISFFNVTGGNRIVYDFNHDSGDFGFDCTSVQKWQTENSTSVNPGIGVWAAPWPANTNNYAWSEKGRVAFENASYHHNVYNLSSSENTAPNGTHKSYIEYRIKRANSNTWRNSENSTTGTGWDDGWARKTDGAQSRDLTAGSSFDLHDKYSGNDSHPRTEDLSCLLYNQGPSIYDCASSRGYRKPIAKDSACSANNQSNNPNITNCDWRFYNGSWAWRYNQGDKYCERVITYHYANDKSDGDFNRSSQKCIELNGDGDGISCQDWTIMHSESTNGPHANNDAWVGDTYSFDHSFWHEGRAVHTGQISFQRSWWGQGPGGPDNIGSYYLYQIGNPAPNPGTLDQDELYDLSVSGTFGPEHAGQTFSEQIDYSPANSMGPDHCSSEGGGASKSDSVYVPYYYHTIPKTSGSVPSQVQQGATISVNGSIKNPSDDRDSELMPGDNENGGRQHTYTQNIGWQRVVFRANNIADVNSKFTANGMRQGSGPGVCEVLGGIGIGGYRGCTVRDSGNTTLQIEEKDLGLSGITLGLEPVGTVVCVALGISDPTHSTSPSDWRIAQPKCTTIIKSPKVQFKYGDVAVGRERLGVSPTCTVNTTAKIQTTSAPNVSLLGISDTEKYQFGSWDEYGVFSSGSILSFGSSGAEAGTIDKAKRLSFGNTDSPYGNYPYGIKCLPNLMNGYSAENTIPADTIYPNQYFTDPSRNTKSRFQRTGNINLTLEPTKTYQAILSLKGYSDCGNDAPGSPLTPAKVRFVVELVGGQKITSSDMEVSSCSASVRPTYQTTVPLGGDGWKGIKRVDLRFMNNNHNAAWETNSSQMRDRNLFVESLKIQWVRNGSEEIATTPLMSAADSRISRTHPDDYYSTGPGNIDPNAICRKTNTDGRWWDSGNVFSDGRVAIPSTEGDLGYKYGLCYGVHIDNIASINDRFDDSETPTPILGPSYDGFRGRNIILYAKDNDNNCANNNGGNININLDMDYKRDGYTKLSEIPRFTLMADCNIIINNTVKEVRASLIAGDAIMTCSSRARTQGECNSKLTVTGAIQAKRLLLWRTSGADLTNPTDARVPAETFVYGVDQMMAGYEYGLANPVLKPSYQRDLPPRY